MSSRQGYKGRVMRGFKHRMFCLGCKRLAIFADSQRYGRTGGRGRGKCIDCLLAAIKGAA